MHQVEDLGEGGVCPTSDTSWKRRLTWTYAIPVGWGVRIASHGLGLRRICYTADKGDGPGELDGGGTYSLEEIHGELSRNVSSARFVS